jgi:hypothetical protein
MTACGGDGDSGDSGATAGSQAQAGAGASDTGGSANKAGETSTPGDAGMSTGGSTTTMAGAGPGPSAGDNAGGTSNPGPQVAMCQEACKTDKDCLDGFNCQDSRCVSTTAPETCKSDELCQAQLSGWTTECNEQSDCLVTQVCVDVGDKMGRCATKAGGAVSCATLQQDEIDTKDFGGKATTVCGKSRAECSTEGVCRERCSKDSCGQYMACNDKTGNCECDNDKACANVPNTSKCVAGQCVCASDADCKTNSNKCSDGVCGCGDASVCDQKQAHPGTSWVCE